MDRVNEHPSTMDQHQVFRAQFVGTVFVASLIYYVYQVFSRPTSKVPGPWYSKWTSMFLTYHWLKGNRAYYVHGLHQKYGPVVRLSPNEVDFSGHLEAVKTIYSLKQSYVKSAFYTNVTSSGEQSLFNTADVNYNRRLRRLLGGPLLESSLKSAEPTVQSHVDLAIQRAKEEMDTRGAADTWKWWTFMATDVIGELTFGESFKTLEQGKESRYTEDLKRVAPLAALRSTFPALIPLTKFLPLPMLKYAREAGERVVGYAKESLARYQRRLDLDPDQAQHTLFTKLIKAQEDDALTTDEIRITAMAYIVAGTDTTANTLTYLVWTVCQHPEVREKLLKELNGLPDDFTDHDLKELPYLNQLIAETLRLYAAAPSALPRSVPEGGAELAGYWLPAGTTVCAQAYTMHRDPVVFPEPEKFIPERWAETTKAMKDTSMPFGRGARVCLGLHLAEMELRHGASRFFREFPNARASSKGGMSEESMRPEIYFLIAPSGHQCLIEKD